MAELLIELFSEEIPARMQAGACDDLKRLVTNALVDRGLLYEGAKAFATPRRLTLVVGGLPPRQPDRREERKGPRLSAPDAARQGFFRSLGVSPDEMQSAALAAGRPVAFAGRGITVEPRGAGNDAMLFALTQRAGRSTVEVAAEIVPEVVRAFPWPRSMRWGTGRLRWARPLHAILCTFTAGQEEPDIVAFDIDGITSGDVTYGHRFLAPEPIRVRRFEDYLERLKTAFVVLDAERRRDIILADARTLAHAQNLDLVEDAALAEEVAGLVEWPVVMMGSFDPAFLDVPDEVIRTTIRANQKCFVLRDPATGRLASRFILTSNLDARDGGAAIVAGNERVVRARLSDARFFWELDRKTPLSERARKLGAVVFHARLGTQGERIERIALLAGELAPLVGADPAEAALAARLAKADLATETVGEFPEVQGIAGKYLARLEGYSDAVAAAVEEHYKPQGPADRVPTGPVSVAVALADKLDMLVGFWAIDEKPTGSKDPFGLRRAALGVIRIVLENGLRLRLMRILAPAIDRLDAGADARRRDAAASDERHLRTADMLAFFADRLKVQLREQGARHDLVDAVLALGAAPSSPEERSRGDTRDDLVLVVRRVEALAAFLATEDGKNLLAGYRRAANILRAEERKDGERAFAADPDGTLFRSNEERMLAGALADAEAEAEACLAAEDFAGAMRAVAALRPAVDAFFDAVTVNADDPALRANRLRLLARLRRTTRTVADLDRVGG